ncbi:hypothetical protein B0H11DRAFT_2077961 [Mycena galericulata]|nr:hypothetical protein B0H11DRAFT_2077961 [Mycena galericulata]
MLLENLGTIGDADVEGDFTPAISGGTGGGGGEGGHRGGDGGFGGAPRIWVEDAYRFRVLRGGTGGVGGPGGSKFGLAGTTEETKLQQQAAKEVATTIEEESLPALFGGYGGSGGGSEIQGGHGGIGQGSKFPKRLLRIDEDTRRLVPHTTLENFKIGAELRQHLRNRGFRTVGGLLEAYDTDVEPPYFKAGHASVLKAALRKFVVQKQNAGVQS